MPQHADQLTFQEQFSCTVHLTLLYRTLPLQGPNRGLAATTAARLMGSQSAADLREQLLKGVKHEKDKKYCNYQGSHEAFNAFAVGAAAWLSLQPPALLLQPRWPSTAVHPLFGHWRPCCNAAQCSAVLLCALPMAPPWCALLPALLGAG